MNARNVSQENLLQVLLAPQVSEKATWVADKHNQIIFRVAAGATRQQVKAAVESLFKVRVLGVQVANVKGKEKRFGGMIGRRGGWKKAFVRLEAGQDLNLSGELK